jgi:hypothetical protein
MLIPGRKAMAIMRRKLLNAMARLGRAAAVYETLTAWDYLRPPEVQAAVLELARNSGEGRTVAILGAGVAGVCAAFELERAGYDCVILEATHRAGGRSLTLRRGSRWGRPAYVLERLEGGCGAERACSRPDNRSAVSGRASPRLKSFGGQLAPNGRMAPSVARDHVPIPPLTKSVQTAETLLKP